MSRWLYQNHESHRTECNVLDVNTCMNARKLIVIILWPVVLISNSAFLNLYRSAEKTCCYDSNTQCKEFNLLEVLCTKVILMSLSNLFEFSSIAFLFSYFVVVVREWDKKNILCQVEKPFRKMSFSIRHIESKLRPSNGIHMSKSAIGLLSWFLGPIEKNQNVNMAQDYSSEQILLEMPNDNW